MPDPLQRVGDSACIATCPAGSLWAATSTRRQVCAGVLTIEARGRLIAQRTAGNKSRAVEFASATKHH